MPEPLSTDRHTHLEDLARLVRSWVLRMTSQAGSGHATSALSAVELMVDLFFGGRLRYDADDPGHPGNDRVIFSKGHASPLLYALWAAADRVDARELLTYRTFGSSLEGHPTRRFRFAEAATGALGQGLSIGVGMALNAKFLDHLSYRTYVLLGDSEMAEGAQWEAMQLAAWYGLDNLVGVLDVNRLGQRGETMYGHDLDQYRRRVAAFGWEAIVIDDGHDHTQVLDAYAAASEVQGRPAMIIARTIKGQGVSFLADRNGWHGKALDEDQLQSALEELGDVDTSVRGRLAEPESGRPSTRAAEPVSQVLEYEAGESLATRDAYGSAIRRLAAGNVDVVALDAEVSNSTRADSLRDAEPGRFFEMFVAEQNMVGAAVGLALRGKVPFVSTFAAFLTRAFDQIRMSVYSDAHVKFIGTHAGVAIGQDGPSQMGLEDLAMFRTVRDSVVLYPCDAVSTERLVDAMAAHPGPAYLRATRGKTPVIYDRDATFRIGGSAVLRQSDHDRVTLVGAGVTTHEALEAAESLEGEGLAVRVVDLYSIKPVDVETLHAAATETRLLLTIEDHVPEGGLGEAVRSALPAAIVPIHSLAVRHQPRSGPPDELLADQGISAAAIVDAVHRHVERSPVASAGGPW